MKAVALALCAFAALTLLWPSPASAQTLGTVFTYQGQLKDAGSPASGNFNMVFTLWNDPTLAAPANQVGPTLTFDGLGGNPPPVAVASGLFTVSLNFGETYNGNARWLEITVSGTTLAPRQELTPAPHALALPGFYTRQHISGPNIIGGHSENMVAAGVSSATISGGGRLGYPNIITGSAATIGGGTENTAAFLGVVSGGVGNDAGSSGQFNNEGCTVGGGVENKAGANGAVSGAYSTIGGGSFNEANGGGTIAGGSGNKTSEGATVGGGAGNTASGFLSTIGGGEINDASGGVSTIGGGTGNLAGEAHSTVGGGVANLAEGIASTIGGGYENAALGTGSTIGGGGDATGGGMGNRVTDDYGTIGGGGNNQAGDNAGTTTDNTYATVAGGEQNNAGGKWATIGGGFGNIAGYSSTIGGGFNNEANGDTCTVGGGVDNIANGFYSTVGGGLSNQASDYSTSAGGTHNIASGDHSTVSGGGDNTAIGIVATVSGGATNTASGLAATVSGGDNNTASGDFGSTIGGGQQNTASGEGSTIGGGVLNAANGQQSAVGGGISNIASGLDSTVPGGVLNLAGGHYSLAAGRRAKVRTPALVGGGDVDGDQGTFVWADGTNADFTSTGPNKFLVRASGGTTLYSNAALTAGVTLAAGGGAWAAVSDRSRKENFGELDTKAVLKRLAEIPITTWNYKSQDKRIRHIGPMGQDFHAAFGVGEDEQHITTIDADGVALAAIQGLHQIVKEKEAEITNLREETAKLRARLDRLEEAILRASK